MIRFADVPQLSGQDAFEAAFRQAVIDYRIGLDGPLTKPVTYALAGNGAFEVRENAIGRFIRRTDKIDGLSPLTEGFHWHLPKIPWGLWERSVAFFRKVMERHDGAEAYIQCFWNAEKQEYFLHVPKQSVSEGSVSFQRDVELEQRHTLALEAHSHNRMGAFWSATDNNDEKATRLFMVVGRLQEQIPDVKLRAGMAGTYFDLTIEQVFESGPDVPKSWLDQVEHRTAKAHLQQIQAMLNRLTTGYTRHLDFGDRHGRARPLHSPGSEDNGHQEVLFDAEGNCVLAPPTREVPLPNRQTQSNHLVSQRSSVLGERTRRRRSRFGRRRHG